MKQKKQPLKKPKKRGDDTKKIQAEIDALRKQAEAEQKAFNTEVAEFQDAEEKKAKKDMQDLSDASEHYRELTRVLRL